MPELIAKTAAAVAVDNDLTILLNWVNIEQVSGFTLIVENVGGGSGNDITDVQIDTSNDGGVTASLDQHAGVPAIPIASGSAKVGAFTETAKFLRVRAVCAATEDTTAKAVLLADSATGRICTLADVKDRLGITDTENDQVINRIIIGLEEIFNGETSRKFIATAANVTEYYTGEGSLLQLNHYPIISITSVKESYDYDFASVEALTENTHYRKIAEGNNGILYRNYSFWPVIPDAIQVVYRGGYCSAGQTPGSGEFAMPADLREAAILQSTFIFKRRDDIGLSGVSSQGGSINKFSNMELLPMVESILKKYRRPSL